MTARPRSGTINATYQNWEEVAQLVYRAGKGRVPIELCRKRSKQYVMLGQHRRKQGHYALIHGDPPDGFLFAVTRNAFDLAETRWVEVHLLVGTGAVDLLRELRSRTERRILVQGWAFFGKLTAFRRLLRPLNPEIIGETLQI